MMTHMTPPRIKMHPAGWAIILAWAMPAGLCRGESFDAITKPSQDVILKFVRPGQVAEVKVVEGQMVRPGELLVRLDDRAEQVQLAQLKAAAEDTIRIKAAKAELDQKIVDLNRLEDGFKKGAATQFEVDNAKLDVTIAGLRHELAKFQHAQDILRYKEARVQLERMRLVSPIAGRVEKLQVEKGEAVDALAPVVLIVNTDPLWVETPVPVEQAVKIKPGQTALVRHGGLPGAKPQAGKVINIDSVADSGTLLVRVELPNPSGRPAGLSVTVEFPAQGELNSGVPATQPAIARKPEGAVNVSQGKRTAK